MVTYMDKNVNSQCLLGNAHSVYQALSPHLKGPGDEARVYCNKMCRTFVDQEFRPTCVQRLITMTSARNRIYGRIHAIQIAVC